MTMTKTSARDFPPVARGNLSDLSNRLAAPRRAIEREFQQMGERLIACVRFLNETSAAYDDLPGTLASPEFIDALGALETISTHVRELDEDCRETQAFLAKLSRFTGEIPLGIAGLTKVVRTFLLFSIKARIVIAPLANRQNDIADFAEAMVASSVSLGSSISAVADAFPPVRDSIDAASSVSDAFASHHAALLGGVAAELTRNLSAMGKHRDWAKGQAAAHSARTERIRSRVGRAVGTLQIGDITRQRVEHVENAMTSIALRDDSDLIAVVCPLLASQIDGAVKDFNGEIKVLAASLGSLAQDAEATLKAADTDVETLLSAGDTAFGAITNSLRQIEGMLREYEQGSAALAGKVDRLVAAVENMLEYLGNFESIGRQIETNSLNAVIKSNSLNDTRQAFQFVALEMRSLAAKTRAPVIEITASMKNTAEILSNYLATRAARKGIGAVKILEIVESTQQNIKKVSIHLRDCVALMAKSGPEAVARLHEAANAVSNQQNFCKDWREICSELAMLGLSGNPDAAARGDVLAQIFEMYTMKAERDIHNALLGSVDQAAKPDRGEALEASLDDIFF